MVHHQSANEQLSDAELVKLALQDSDNFALLIKRYETKLAAYLRRLFNMNQTDIEDVLQEVFLKIYQNLNDFDADLKFSSWAYRIAHNQAVSSFRKTKARGFSFSLEDRDWQELTSSLNQAEEVNRQLDRTKIEQALLKLPPKYRHILILKFLEEKSYQEIGDILKKPAGTVASLLNRGKKLLAKDLKQYYGTN